MAVDKIPVSYVGGGGEAYLM